MNAESIVKIISTSLGTFTGLLIRAFVDGDDNAWARVKDIIPSPLKSEAKLEHEEARYRRIKRERGQE
jgi:hypothetical protein